MNNLKLWIARDKDDTDRLNQTTYGDNAQPIYREVRKSEILWLFDHKPIRTESGIFVSDPPYRGPIGKLLEDLFPIFPSLTWENSPQQVELKLIKDETK